MVVSSRLREATALGAGVEQREAAGAVGRFHHAGLEAALPDRRRLLVAGHAENADGRAEQVGRGRAELAGAVAHLRQQRGRHAEQRGTGPSSHCAAADVEQQRARGIGGVGRVHLAAGEPPQQEAVDRAEGEPARFAPPRARRRRGRAARRSWWRRNRDRAAARSWRRSRGSCPARAQRVADVGGAPVLPDDGVVDRLAGGAVPDDGGLALIGDADAGDVLGARARPSPSPRARSRPSPPRSPPGRARPSPAPDRSGAAPAARAASGSSAASNTMARVEVVPWSMARRAVGNDAPCPAHVPNADTSRRQRREPVSSATRPAWRLPSSLSAWMPVGQLARHRAVIVAALAPSAAAWSAPRPCGPAAPSTTPA